MCAFSVKSAEFVASRRSYQLRRPARHLPRAACEDRHQRFGLLFLARERRVDGCRRFAADAREAADWAVISFNCRASSCLRRSMNQRPAGPGGLSVRKMADMLVT